jgi:transcriptional regulator with XRE-family HTH domain
MPQQEVPERSRFAIELQQHREAMGLSRAAAARRAGISSSRWSQVEQGYESKSGVIIPAIAGRDFVLKAATALHWPRSEALEAADLPVEHLPEDKRAEDTEDWTTTDQALWSRMTPQRKKAFRYMMRVMEDEYAVFDAPTATVDPRAHFSDAEPTPKGTRVRT